MVCTRAVFDQVCICGRYILTDTAPDASAKKRNNVPLLSGAKMEKLARFGRVPAAWVAGDRRQRQIEFSQAYGRGVCLWGGSGSSYRFLPEMCQRRRQLLHVHNLAARLTPSYRSMTSIDRSSSVEGSMDRRSAISFGRWALTFPPRRCPCLSHSRWASDRRSRPDCTALISRSCCQAPRRRRHS